MLKSLFVGYQMLQKGMKMCGDGYRNDTYTLFRASHKFIEAISAA